MLQGSGSRIVLVLFLVGALAISPRAGEDADPEVLVFAAASLTDVLGEIAESFERLFHCKVRANPASSGTLARQIAQGGHPDVYISANTRWMEYLDSLGYIYRGIRRVVAYNELVLVAPADSPLGPVGIDRNLDFVRLLGEGRLSMGDPAHVPAGTYARDCLVFFGWFDPVTPGMLMTKDVRSALMMVEMGEASMGIVYHTDALRSNKIRKLGLFPSECHKPIVYEAGLCGEKSSGAQFLDYLSSDAAKAIWSSHGFRN